jgi:hypothetical protein
MTIRRCIPGLLAGNQLSRDQAERMGGLFDDLERDYSSKFGKQAAEAMASEETVKRFAAEAALKKRQAALQIKAQQQIAADVRKFRVDKPGASAEALLASDDRAPYFNVEFRSKAIADEHFALMNGILEKHSRNVIGQVRNYAELREFSRKRLARAPATIRARNWPTLRRDGRIPSDPVQCTAGPSARSTIGECRKSTTCSPFALSRLSSGATSSLRCSTTNGCSTQAAIR